MAEENTCLGKTFNSEAERREYFRNELRNLLPGLKKIDGFPLGEDEDVIGLSDPPYYTACPNPWLNDFIEEWEYEKRELHKNHNQSKRKEIKEPYAADISEGKNNPIYSAHNYHTKVPHIAIMRYILHYTEPGDIILDGFAGTGMTGVAAATCENPDLETKYRIENEWKTNNGYLPHWGSRKAIIGDLSPIASFIAYNYTTSFDLIEYEKEIITLLEEFNKEYGWMYQTKHLGETAHVNYTVWSEILACPNCNFEFKFSDEFFDKNSNRILENINCKVCNSQISKKTCTSIFETYKDKASGELFRRPKRDIYLINYTYKNKKYEKTPDENDYAILKKIEALDFPKYAPCFELPDMQMIRVGRVKTTNVTHIHQFFLDRPLLTLAYFWKKSRDIKDERISKIVLFTIEQMIWGFSLLSRYVPSHFSQVNQYLSGVFYIASHVSEISPNYILDGKIKRLLSAFSKHHIKSNNVVSFTNDCSDIRLKENSIDYIFTDPPFGENIYYSDLNILIEAWHKVLTNAKSEAIVDRVKNKTILDYQFLMEKCFKKYYFVLKPGKWITVEFSNTSAAIWNGIQTALQKVGFIIANVSALDKKQGTFQSINSPTAVKQDLVISCYKPTNRIVSITNSSPEQGVWTFISEHLSRLPIYLVDKKSTKIVIERNSKILYDRLVSFYVIKGFAVSIDARDFLQGLKQRFIERDSMYFTQEQVVEYDRKKSEFPTVIQTSWQIATENEGIEWLKRELKDKKLKYQEIQPNWMQAITAVRKGDILPELRDILQQNFIEESDGSWRVPDMNEANDREFIRKKALHKEFSGYVDLANNPKSKKMKEVRVEALRAGFKNCWDTKDFETIVKLSDKIPRNLLLEDEQLLMYYDIAKDRV